MPDRETWAFINSFAPWFSALGTGASAVVALYLARRGSRTKLRVHCGIYHAVTQGQPSGGDREYLQIQATNLGFRETTVQGLMWRTGALRKAEVCAGTARHAVSTRLPAKLAYSDQVLVPFPS
jgi:hypothetical protein